MKIAKKLLSFLIVAAMALNFLVIGSVAAKPNDYEDYGLNAKVWFEVGWEVGGVFTPLQPGEDILQNQDVTVRLWAETDFLAGNQAYMVMYDHTMFGLPPGPATAAYNIKANSDPGNMEYVETLEYIRGNITLYHHIWDFNENFIGNRFIDRACASKNNITGNMDFPRKDWPDTFTQEEKDLYTAIKFQIAANSNADNGGFPEFHEGDNWFAKFKLRAKQDIVEGMDAHICTDIRWWRTTETPGNHGYFYKVAAPDQLSSSGISVGLDWQYDFSGADIHLPIPPLPTSTISFDTDGGNEIEALTGDVGAEVPAVDDPVKEGYDFGGWDPALPEVFPEDDLEVTALWQIKEYDITFELDNGNPDVVVKTNHGAMPVAPTPTKAHHTFLGWAPELVEATEDATYTAQWDPELLEVFFYGMGGSPVFTIVDTPYGEIPEAPTVTRDGYEFLGWSLDSVGEVLGEPLPVTEPEMEYYARWEEAVVVPDEVTVSFNTAGGSAIADLVGDAGSPFPAVADPVKDGYTFKGWSPMLPAVFPAVDMTYTAQWELNSYEITFVFDNGDDDLVLDVDHGDTPAVDDPVREGYTFLGWDPEIAEATEDATYTAQWELNSYEITFVFDNGDDDEVLDVDHGDTPAIADPEKEGYTFLGWDPELVEASEDATYTALWELNSYEITFVLDNGEDDVVVSTDHGAVPVAPTGFTKEGYTFEGWDPELVEASEDATYTALWEEVPADMSTITFDSAGGSAVAALTGEVDSEVPEVEDPVREGYTFLGWAPALPEVFPEEDVTLVAQWKANLYNITFDLDNGTVPTASLVAYGEMPDAPTGFSKPGYDFVGWEPEVVAVTGDANYTAQWKIKKYEITFVFDNGDENVIIGVDHGEMPAIDDPVREGYTFLGWDPELAEASEDAVYTALWEINSYDITFKLENGEDDVVVATNHGALPEAPEGFEKEGYTFLGWEPALAVATEDASYTAQWKLKGYEITFVFDNGDEDLVLDVDHGDTPEIDDPVKEGYTFLGWDPELVEATEDAVYTALWELNVYEITFVLDNGEDNLVVETDHGALPEAPAVTKEGHDFVEWTPELSPAYGDETYTAVWAAKSYTITFVLGKDFDDVTVDFEYGEMPEAPDVPPVARWNFTGWTPELETVTGQATYTAVWEEKEGFDEYTIIFDPNGGVGGGEQIVEEGIMPDIPGAPVREGYIFMGWGDVVEALGDATYKAKWLGDINGDGEINTADALMALKHVTGEAPLAEDQLALADVNGDGRITSLDALILLQFISGKLTELPYLTFG